MISWNESKTIDLALRGIKGLVDEVIIADNGSFDGTQEIARKCMGELGLHGQVIDVKAKSLGQARLASYNLCKGPWILLIDSNLVLSKAVRSEFLRMATRNKNKIGCIRSLNLMGDYEHYFSGRPFHAHHPTFFVKGVMPFNDLDRPTVNDRSKLKMIEPWAVNLSRVRPAWRSWYRGEPFDRRYYKRGKGKRRQKHVPTNRQFSWKRLREYPSLIEFTEAVEGLSFADVKKNAPEWYLQELRTYARPLKQGMKKNLPIIIKEEQKSPRYRLIKDGNKIVGRWPEL